MVREEEGNRKEGRPESEEREEYWKRRDEREHSNDAVI